MSYPNSTNILTPPCNGMEELLGAVESVTSDAVTRDKAEHVDPGL